MPNPHPTGRRSGATESIGPLPPVARLDWDYPVGSKGLKAVPTGEQTCTTMKSLTTRMMSQNARAATAMAETRGQITCSRVLCAKASNRPDCNLWGMRRLIRPARLEVRLEKRLKSLMPGSAPAPTSYSHEGNRMTHQPKMHQSQHDLLQALETIGPMTRLELERYIDINDTTATRRFQRLRKRGLVRIAGWQRTTGGFAAMYGLANGQPDEPQPPRKTQQERHADYRKRHSVRISVRRYGERSTLSGVWAGLVR
jgi:hypothetical protein